MKLVEKLAKQQVDVRAETLRDTLCSVEAKHFSILWLKG